MTKPKNKRKANSPLQDTSTGGANQSSQTSSDLKQTSRKQRKQTQPSKVSKQTLDDNQSNLNGSYLQQSTPSKNPQTIDFKAIPTMQNMQNMNYTQTPQSLGPFMQSLQQSPGATPYVVNTGIPPWAAELIDDIKTIKKAVARIDTIEKLVNKVSSKVDSLEDKLKNVDNRVQEVEKSTGFINEEFEDVKNKLQETSSNLSNMTKKCENLESMVTALEDQNQNLQDKANDLEWRSMRENLLFHGLNEEKDENCEELVKNFISNTLEIDENIVFDRVHRLGKPKHEKIRPIVAKFHYFKQRENVLKVSSEKSAFLKTLEKRVGIQQTKDVLQKRRIMGPIMDREKAAGKQVKWSGARLLVRDSVSGQYKEVTE